ncbi:hypothetical protein AB8U03_15635 [Clostridium sp. Mt-5]|uniref:Uncharacterized protein n=1 Tax=Clostridium moutaii TaxID=3240932 RepID=A0ABV4BV90_9CLOT
MSDLLKRRGIFKVTRDLIINNPEAINELLKDVLVVDVDNDFITDTLIYKGYSKHFDLLKDNEMPPGYIARIHTDDKSEIENIAWEKV